MSIRGGIVIAALALALASCREYGMRDVPGPGADVDASYFYDALAPYGHWINYGSYGWCWVPDDVGFDWRPYSAGSWAYSDFGWTWVADEPWGWAPYHYGRWAYDSFYGWIWVPGDDWAPAWVAWRYGDDWVGWAPLPPDAGWSAGAGLSFPSADAGRIPAPEWCFIDRRHLLDPRLRVRISPAARNVTLLERTKDATLFAISGGRPVDRGIDVALAERWTGRKVPRFALADVSSPAQARAARAQGTLAIFRPNFRPAVKQAAPPSPLQRRRVEDLTDRTMEKQRLAEQRRLETSLSRERARLERAQKQEMRGARTSPDLEELRRRQENERKAFLDQVARERQMLQRRWQKKPAAPPPSAQQAPPQQAPPPQPEDKGDRGQGNDQGRGHGKGHG